MNSLKIYSAFKLLIPIHFLLASYSYTSAQCIANAGKDTLYCIPQSFGEFNPVIGGTQGGSNLVLGGSPVVEGGILPYTYVWETIVEAGSSTLEAEELLDDVTKANPILDEYVLTTDSVHFVLTVTDSIGSICRDTVIISFSGYSISPGQPGDPNCEPEQVELILTPNDTITDCIGCNYEFTINRGDTVQLRSNFNVGSIRPPNQLIWIPDEGMSNPNTSFPLVSPDTTTSYSLYYIDSVGCTTDTIMCNKVLVTDAVSNISSLNHNVRVTIFPNPLSPQSILTVEHPHTHLTKYI